MKKCSNCKKELEPIFIIDGTNTSSVRNGFVFTKEKPTKSWTGSVNNEAGVVRAFFCSECKKVELYAIEGEKDLFV